MEILKYFAKGKFNLLSKLKWIILPKKQQQLKHQHTDLILKTKKNT
jgi:hypothetical protein